METAYYNYYYLEEPRIMPPNFNITKMIRPWIEQNHYSVVKVEQFYQSRIYFSMEIEKTSEMDCDWWIPITYITPSGINFTLLKSGETHVVSGSKFEDDWIILNLRQTGKY